MSNLMRTLNPRDNVMRYGAGPGLKSGHGSTDGLLDFYGDVGTASLGYSSVEQRMVLRRMLDQSIPPHAPNVIRFEERERAATRLCEASAMDKVFFCTSGAEAVEAAIKLARRYQYSHGAPERTIIASYVGGFHGRTYGALACGDGPPAHYDGFGPMPGDFVHFKEISDIPRNAAAVCLAPVFGHHDVRPLGYDFLSELREYCDTNGILLIFDEIQSGAGRAGKAFTYAQRIGVEPDIICLAKGMAMGAACGAMLAQQEIADAFTPGVHFSTFGGAPLAMAFVNGMLDWATPAHLIEVERHGNLLRDFLGKLSWTKNVRGIGQLTVFFMEEDSFKFADACVEEGLLVASFRPGIVKITPPLNMSLDDMMLGLELMIKGYQRAFGA